MQASEREELKHTIEKELDGLHIEIERLKEQTKPIPPDRAIGRLTRMEAIQSKSVSEANLRKAQGRARRLGQALRKIDEDPDYGLCTICEEPIPIKRLLLVPESTRCVPCASQRPR